MKTLAIIALLSWSQAVSGQTNPILTNWKRLSDVRFTKKFNKEVQMYFLYPTFGPTVRELRGKEIQIRGYLIPVDETANLYVISAQPMAMCFFCGGSGPESMVELQLSNKRQRFKTDEMRSIRGKLRLNPADIEHLNYILTEAEIVN